MSKRNGADPIVRFADDAPSDRTGQALAALFRAVPVADAMSPDNLASVRRKLLRTKKRRASRSAFRVLAIVLSVLVGGVSAAVAEWGRAGWPRSWSKISAPSRVIQDTPAPSAAKRLDPPAIVVPGPVVPTPPSAIAPSSRNGVPQLQERSQRSGLALESESLERALVALRREHDARATLALLDDHDARFPHGELELEATVARLEALLLLGRRADALQRLEKMPLERGGRRIDLLVLRAELLAERDCSLAIADFDRALERPLTSALEERVLYGRAACRLRNGDQAGAHADLGLYLSRYPNGRFAETVRAHLK